MKILVFFLLICVCKIHAQNVNTQNVNTLGANGTDWTHIFFVQLWPTSWLSQLHNPQYDFNNTFFTIHGIWPQYSDGKWPQYCTNQPKFNVTKLDSIRKELGILWTDFENAPKFWEHEYAKHMTCLEEDPFFMDEKLCFQAGLALRKNLNIFSWLAQNGIFPRNKPYAFDRIENAINDFVGHKTVVTCENDILTEIRICMGRPWFTLIDCTQTEISEKCSKEYVLYKPWK